MATNELSLEPDADFIERTGSFFSGVHCQLKGNPTPVELGESFELWCLDAAVLKKAISQKSFPADKTGYQHHQILVAHRARGYVLSVESTPGHQKVVRAAVSRIAERIDDAITVLDKTYAGNETAARLVVEWSYLIYAFWLVGSSRVYLVSAPARFKNLLATRDRNALDFLRALDLDLKRLRTDDESFTHESARW